MSEMADLLKRIGTPDQWMISEDDILHVMLSGPCEHLIVPLDRCRECFVATLVRRQMAALALRLGCDPDIADDVAEKLVREHRAKQIIGGDARQQPAGRDGGEAT